jgi:acyl-CoA oxidase
MIRVGARNGDLSVKNGINIINITTCLGVHMNLYMQTIKNLGTEKHKPYLLKAATMEDVGSFAMTELSHGSNVQSMQTTATYDKKAKEFVLNTPT